MGGREGRLSLSDIERSPFALENIVGKTLLTATEQPAGFIKQLDLLNTLISGEKVPVNRKNKKITDVRSTAKLVWSMNAKPAVREGGNGIFRRIKIVDFPALAPHLRDPDVKTRITELEPPGILTWAVEGLKRLKDRGGFEVPEGVEESVKEFEHSNDPVAQFLEEMCELGEGEGYHHPRGKFYDAYQKWCKARGYKAKNAASAREDFHRLKVRDGKTQGERVYRGVKLVRDPDTYLSTYRDLGSYRDPGAF